MKIRYAFILFIIVLSAEILWGSQQIETVVFPSEDEIAEAFALGEISFEQFILLTELIANQIEPSSFLLEEIPRSLLRIETFTDTSKLISQEQYFLQNNSTNQSTNHVTIKNQYATYLDENSPTRYQSAVNYTAELFRFNFILKKEFSGRERFTRRYLSIYPSVNQSVIVGNFAKRFGLGGVVGYSRKLLTYSDNIDSESFMFPDYGGFNGVFVHSMSNSFDVQALTSYSRNDKFAILTSALQVDTKSPYPNFIIGWHEIKNKVTGRKFHDIKSSLYKNFTYTNGFVKTELVAEFNKHNNSDALLLDGKHKMNRFYFTYSLWNYGESFLNISGGSKTSLISEQVEIENVQYQYSSKRSDQLGGLLKTKYTISDNWQADIASIYAFKNSDTTELQLFAQLSRKFNVSTKLSLDILFRNKERNVISSDVPYKKYQSRLMIVQKTDKVYMRNYLLVLDQSDEPTYLGFFTELKLKTSNYGKLHFWFNMSRINSTTKQLDYLYAFVKNEIRLDKSIFISFKLSHRYNRTATDRHRNQFTIDTSWQL